MAGVGRETGTVETLREVDFERVLVNGGSTRVTNGTRDRIRRRRFHQWVFVAAAVYNVAWGLYAAMDPQWLFRFAGMEPMAHPQIFATLGMVVGLYGVLYLEVARRPEEGWLLAAVGLAGKILGPLGFAVVVATGQWPLSTVILVLTNDLIWWIPFGLYLVDSWSWFRRDLGTMSERS